MSRLLVLAVALLVIVVGGLFLLSSRASEQPQTRVEKIVPLANLQN